MIQHRETERYIQIPKGIELPDNLLQGLGERGIIGCNFADQLPDDPQLRYKAMAAAVLLGQSFAVPPYDKISEASEDYMATDSRPGLNIRQIKESIKLNRDIADLRGVSLVSRLLDKNVAFLGLRQTQVEHFVDPLAETIPTFKLTITSLRMAQCLKLQARGLPDEEIRHRIHVQTPSSVQVLRYQAVKSLEKRGYTPQFLDGLLPEILTARQRKQWHKGPPPDPNKDILNGKSPTGLVARTLEQSTVNNNVDQPDGHAGIKTVINQLVLAGCLPSEHIDILEAHLSGSRQLRSEEKPTLWLALTELGQFVNIAHRDTEQRRLFSTPQSNAIERSLTPAEKQLLALLVGDPTHGLPPRALGDVLKMDKVKRVFTKETLLETVETALSKLITAA